DGSMRSPRGSGLYANSSKRGASHERLYQEARQAIMGRCHRRAGRGGSQERKWHSVKGTRKDAEAARAKLINDINTAIYVAPSKLRVDQHMQNRLAQWEASGRISAKTAERYRELINNQINPHIGHRLVQKLKAAEIEAWHSTLTTHGRKDGAGGTG